MNVLVINAGSSSLKYQLMDPDTGAVSAKGLCERIGLDGKFTYKAGGKTVIDAQDVAMPTHAEAIEAVLAALVNPEYGVIKSMDEIDAVGHRVLHGGMAFTESCLIDDACIAAIEKCIPLGPLHNPANLMGIRACQKVMPAKPQLYLVAVFALSSPFDRLKNPTHSAGKRSGKHNGKHDYRTSQYKGCS